MTPWLSSFCALLGLPPPVSFLPSWAAALLASHPGGVGVLCSAWLSSNTPSYPYRVFLCPPSVPPITLPGLPIFAPVESPSLFLIIRLAPCWPVENLVLFTLPVCRKNRFRRPSRSSVLYSAPASLVAGAQPHKCFRLSGKRTPLV